MQFGRIADRWVSLLAWVFTTRHYASTVYAVAVCSSVHLYAYVCTS